MWRPAARPGPSTVPSGDGQAVCALAGLCAGKAVGAALNGSGGHMVGPRRLGRRLRLIGQAGCTASGFSFGPMTALRLHASAAPLQVGLIRR